MKLEFLENVSSILFRYSFVSNLIQPHLLEIVLKWLAGFGCIWQYLKIIDLHERDVPNVWLHNMPSAKYVRGARRLGSNAMEKTNLFFDMCTCFLLYFGSIVNLSTK